MTMLAKLKPLAQLFPDYYKKAEQNYGTMLDFFLEYAKDKDSNKIPEKTKSKTTIFQSYIDLLHYNVNAYDFLHKYVFLRQKQQKSVRWLL